MMKNDIIWSNFLNEKSFSGKKIVSIVKNKRLLLLSIIGVFVYRVEMLDFASFAFEICFLIEWI